MFYAHCLIYIVDQQAVVDLNEINEVINKFFCLISSLKKYISLSRLSMSDFIKDSLVWSGW